MSISKSIAARAFDVAVICALIYGDKNMQLFGLCIAAIMTIAAWLGVFTGLKPDTAKTIHGTAFKRCFGMLVNIGYTYGLIVSGSPIWAAFYLLGFIVVRMHAAKISGEPVEVKK